MGDEGRNPIDFGSQGQRSRSLLPPCEGMPRFALSSSHYSRPDFCKCGETFQLIRPFLSSSIQKVKLRPHPQRKRSGLISQHVWKTILTRISCHAFISMKWSSGGVVVKLLACGARCPGFDSRSRHYDFRDWFAASNSRYGWNIAKATKILKTTNLFHEMPLASHSGHFESFGFWSIEKIDLVDCELKHIQL